MAKVSQKTIDLIKNTADIVDVVSEFVPLQTAGKNMKGLCPFHSEKTPSFFVSKERQIFNCFGCGKKGNVITFIQEYKHLSFIDSLKYLADKYNIDLELEDSDNKQKANVDLYKINEQALQFFSLNLLNIDSGKSAFDYLINRGLNLEIIKIFDLGYALNKSNGLIEHLSKSYQPIELLNAGLITRNQDGEFYDLFRNRIIFPIHDIQNRVVGFSGRIFNNQSNPAKYVNTPYTKLFSKGVILYNLNRAIPHIRTKNRVVLMEGYMDVIKASMVGVSEAVCSMGTQLTIDQALLIKEYTDNVIVCYDGDKPGQEATYKAIKLLEHAKLNVKVVSLPLGLDPDEYISKNNDFLEYINNNSVDQYEFVYQMILANKDLSKPVEIENAKTKLFDFFSKTSGMIREIYFKRFASDTFINYDTLIGDYHQYKIDEKILQDYKFKINRTQKKKVIMPKYKIAEITVLNYYLHSVEYRDIIESKFKLLKFQDQDISSIIYTANVSLITYPDNPIVVLKSKLSEKYRKFLDSIIFEKYNYNIEDLEDCIKVLEIANIKDEIAINEELAKAALKNGDKLTYIEYCEINKEKLAKIIKLEGRTNEQKSSY